MSRNFIYDKTKSRLAPLNNQLKTIEKTGVSKAIFGTLKTQQQEQQTPQSFQTNNNSVSQSKRFEYSANQKLSPQQKKLKQSHYVREQHNSGISKLQNQSKILSENRNHSESKGEQRIQFLEHCMNEYKDQALAMYSKLTQRQKYYEQSKHKYQAQIFDLKQQISSLQKQIQGQSLLIQQCHQKYDSQVKQRQLCLQLITQQKSILFNLNTQIDSLQRTVVSTREVSVNLIKENQNLKAQIIIEREKYELLFQDYSQLSVKYQKEVKKMCDENIMLIRKLDDAEMELKIHQKDKEIENLLNYENSIHKRQTELTKMNQASSSPPSVIYHQNSATSPYQYLPRRLNFQDENNSRSAKKGFLDKRQQQAQNHIQIIQLQKNKISHLENQLRLVEKRNKQLQTLMVKFMK